MQPDNPKTLHFLNLGRRGGGAAAPPPPLQRGVQVSCTQSPDYVVMPKGVDGFSLVALWYRGSGSLVLLVAVLPWCPCVHNGLVAQTFVFDCVFVGFGLPDGLPPLSVGPLRPL